MGVADNVKPYLKPKEWLIIGGVVQLGFAIWLMMDAEGFAEKAWTDLTASELEIATSYELFWGWFSVPWGIWAIMIATPLKKDGALPQNKNKRSRIQRLRLSRPKKS